MPLQIIDVRSADEFAEIVCEKLTSQIQAKTSNDASGKLPQYVSKRTLAKMMDWSLSTIERRIREGFLQPYRVGGKIRFKVSEVEEAIEANPVNFQDK